MNLEDVMQMTDDRPWYRLSPEELEERDLEQRQTLETIFQNITIPQAAGLRIVRGAPKAGTKALAKIKKPKVRKVRKVRKGGRTVRDAPRLPRARRVGGPLEVRPTQVTDNRGVGGTGPCVSQASGKRVGPRDGPADGPVDRPTD